jgi:hypothetical protein
MKTQCLQNGSYNDHLLCSKWSHLNADSTLVWLIFPINIIMSTKLSNEVNTCVTDKMRVSFKNLLVICTDVTPVYANKIQVQ